MLETGERFGPVQIPIIPLRVEEIESDLHVVYYRQERNYILRNRDTSLGQAAGIELWGVLKQGI